MFCNVIITRPFDQTFTYRLKKDQIVKEGSIISIPFGKSKKQIGMVESVFKNISSNNNYKIKEVERVFESITLSKNIIEFIYWISDYTLSPRGLVLKLFLINEKIIDYIVVEKKNNLFCPEKIKLNNDQLKAVTVINSLFFKPSLPLVLEGVTGSGKTEVFFEAIENVIKRKKQALIMVPEIALTSQLEARFLKRFGFKPSIWHSKISVKKRKDIWHRCYLGDSIIVLGARSSLFLPFKKLSTSPFLLVLVFIFLSIFIFVALVFGFSPI